MSQEWTPTLKAQAESEARRKSLETGQRWAARWVDDY